MVERLRRGLTLRLLGPTLLLGVAAGVGAAWLVWVPLGLPVALVVWALTWLGVALEPDD